jgi:hypothetical protein
MGQELGTPFGGGCNASTVALRVVISEEKGTQCRGYNWATLFLGDINTGPSPSGWGSLKFETVRYCHESCWIRALERLRWRGPTVTNY